MRLATGFAADLADHFSNPCHLGDSSCVRHYIIVFLFDLGWAPVDDFTGPLRNTFAPCHCHE